MTFRRARLAIGAGLLGALFACNNRSIHTPSPSPSATIQHTFVQNLNNELDILFVVDDSRSMLPVQQNLAANFPTFIDVLKTLPAGLPNLHIGVATTNNGAGKYSSQYAGSFDMTRCDRPDAGRLISVPREVTDGVCATARLNGGASFIEDIADPTVSGGRRRNYSGDITDVFSCIARVGTQGCGFEAVLESAKLALTPSTGATPATNPGFVRPNAFLAVIFITNEDDCSVSMQSEILDPSPSRNSPTSDLGSLQSFRCTEFGILCNGQKVPRSKTALLANCTSNDAAAQNDPAHSLIPVQTYIDFFRNLKPQQKFIIAAVSGPSEPFSVVNGDELDPPLPTGAVGLQRSCPAGGGVANGTYADPAVRVNQVVSAFGEKSRLASICQNSYRDSMQVIANLIGRSLGFQCLEGKLAVAPDFNTAVGPGDTVHSGKVIDPNKVSCTVEDVVNAGEKDQRALTSIRACNPNGEPAGSDPCWALMVDSRCDVSGANMQICRNGFNPDGVDPMTGSLKPCLEGPNMPPDGTSAIVHCSSFVQ